MRARFDDLDPGQEKAFEFALPVRTLVASSLEHVGPLFEAVERYVRQEGWWAAGYVSYEAAPGLDPHLAVRQRAGGFAELPLAWFGLFRDRREIEPVSPPQPGEYAFSDWTPSIFRDRFEADVEAIRFQIAEGETYQVNHTFRLRAGFQGSAEALYRDLVSSQPTRYAAFLDLDRFQIASASPELFFSLQGRRMECRPMKGTARRGRWSGEDLALGEALSASEKERAENLMIVDLVRNDLGRVSEFGSVEVERLFTLERYPTVWQLTSTVASTLRPNVSLRGVFEALFPCGSVTGAPKIRTMEIIAETETDARFAYCGAIGWVGPDANGEPTATFSVGIRTVMIDQAQGRAEYGVGGGITWASQPSAEYQETQAKALLLAGRRAHPGLIETLAWDAGRGFWFRNQHLDRMEASASYFGLSFDREQAGALLDRLVDQLSGLARIRLLLEGGRLAAEWSPLPAGEPEAMRVALDREPISSDDIYLFHKTTQRREYSKRVARHPEVDDVLLVNERGEVTEATTANLVVLLEGRWWTPPIEAGCLPGIYRQILLDKGDIAERPILIQELLAAQQFALVNSVRLWRPAVLSED